MPADTTRRWHGWRHPMFWKMLGADFLLVTMLAVAYPAPVTTRLLLVLLAILVVSVVLNMTLTPHHRGPPAPDGGDKV